MFTVTTTSSAETQVPFVTVHRRVRVPLVDKPVTVVVGELGVVMKPVPLTKVHAPVPTLGVLAAIVAVAPEVHTG